MKKTVTLLFCLLQAFGTSAQFVVQPTQEASCRYVTTSGLTHDFGIVNDAQAATILVDPNDWKPVLRAANDLADDVRKVSGVAAQLEQQAGLPITPGSIIVGTIGHSQAIDQLITQKKLDVTPIHGQWESFLIETIDGNLVIAGSDKRGTIYGIYDLSEKMGVSPWYYWADVPVPHQNSLYVKAGRYVQPSPKVKYRGIFINDEDPSFGSWAKINFGGINSKMYATMFELLLRLKANYFWPAMWGKAFNEDDPLNPVVANGYGIIMGTSHHEPMMRAHKEYTSRRTEVGAWNYTTNKERLDRFFTEGLERNKNYDNLITIGMRGDGDVAMSQEGDEANMKVLQNVVDGQRSIIENVYGKPAEEVPQMWAVFTEVQRYYDKGFSVPDDVLLVLCDNNWGYIRRTCPAKEKNRKGGVGLYYHIDMNGGPWNDRWINTSPIPKLHEQFKLAYESGIDDLWIVNVGDLKPKELPIDFIMKYAWNPDAISANQVWDYTVDWARQNFGDAYAREIADIVSKYSKYNLWRKPEVQTLGIFSVVNHHETKRVVSLWNELENQVEQLRKRIPAAAQDAFYQLVYYPAKASAGVAKIYLLATMNHLYAKQGRTSTNDLADQVRSLFETDKILSDYYNQCLSGGKWKGMMSDRHIGYEKWSMPKENTLPELMEVKPALQPTLGVAVEGCEQAWPGAQSEAVLPTFNVLDNQTYQIEVFNRGLGILSYTAETNQDWVVLHQPQGFIEKDAAIKVSIDWNKLGIGTHEAIVRVVSNGNTVPVKVKAVKAEIPVSNQPFYTSLTGDEYSIPAYGYSRKVAGKQAQWTLLPDLGREKGCMGISPVTALSCNYKDAPCLEYQVYLPEAGKTTLCIGILPTQDVNPERGLRMAVELNKGERIVLDARQGFVDTFKEYTKDNIVKSNNLKPLPPVNHDLKLIKGNCTRRNEVFDNLRWLDVTIDVKQPGMHTFKVYMVDPEIVLERIVVNPNNTYPSYFGAPSKRHITTAND